MFRGLGVQEELRGARVTDRHISGFVINPYPANVENMVI